MRISVVLALHVTLPQQRAEYNINLRPVAIAVLQKHRSLYITMSLLFIQLHHTVLQGNALRLRRFVFLATEQSADVSNLR